MNTQLSCFLDNELDTHDQQALLQQLETASELRNAWGRYQLIGEVLRGEVTHLDSDLMGRVMHELRDDPVIVAPHMRVGSRNAQRKLPSFVAPDFLPRLMQHSTALAAAVAGVAVVSWLAFHYEEPMPVAQLVQNEQPSLLAAQRVRLANPANEERMQEYLVAHQAHSPGHQMRAGAGYIRMVSGER